MVEEVKNKIILNKIKKLAADYKIPDIEIDLSKPDYNEERSRITQPTSNTIDVDIPKQTQTTAGKPSSQQTQSIPTQKQEDKTKPDVKDKGKDVDKADSKPSKDDNVSKDTKDKDTKSKDTKDKEEAAKVEKLRFSESSDRIRRINTFIQNLLSTTAKFNEDLKYKAFLDTLILTDPVIRKYNALLVYNAADDIKNMLGGAKIPPILFKALLQDYLVNEGRVSPTQIRDITIAIRNLSEMEGQKQTSKRDRLEQEQIITQLS